MGQGGVVHLWIVAVDLVHPALTEKGKTSIQVFFFLKGGFDEDLTWTVG